MREGLQGQPAKNRTFECLLLNSHWWTQQKMQRWYSNPFPKHRIWAVRSTQSKYKKMWNRNSNEIQNKHLGNEIFEKWHCDLRHSLKSEAINFCRQKNLFLKQWQTAHGVSYRHNYKAFLRMFQMAFQDLILPRVTLVLVNYITIDIYFCNSMRSFSNFLPRVFSISSEIMVLCLLTFITLHGWNDPSVTHQVDFIRSGSPWDVNETNDNFWKPL